MKVCTKAHCKSKKWVHQSLNTGSSWLCSFQPYPLREPIKDVLITQSRRNTNNPPNSGKNIRIHCTGNNQQSSVKVKKVIGIAQQCI